MSVDLNFKETAVVLSAVLAYLGHLEEAKTHPQAPKEPLEDVMGTLVTAQKKLVESIHRTSDFPHES